MTHWLGKLRRIGGITNMTADEARREYNQLGPMTMTPERIAALSRMRVTDSEASERLASRLG